MQLSGKIDILIHVKGTYNFTGLELAFTKINPVAALDNIIGDLNIVNV